MVANMSDDDIWRLNRGGHDPHKIYAAYHGGGEAQGPADGDPRQDDQGLRHGRVRRGAEHHAPAEEDGHVARSSAFRDRFNVPIPDDKLDEVPYLHVRRGLAGDASTCASAHRSVGGYAAGAPAQGRAARSAAAVGVRALLKSTEDREISTTMAFVQILQHARARQEASASSSCRSCPTSRAPSAWKACSASSASDSQRGPALHAAGRRPAHVLQGETRTARSCRKASTRPARCASGSRRRRRTARTACR